MCSGEGEKMPRKVVGKGSNEQKVRVGNKDRKGGRGKGGGGSGGGIGMGIKLFFVIVPLLTAFAATAVKDYYSNCQGRMNHPDRESWEILEMGDTEVRCADYNHAIRFAKSPDGVFAMNGIIFTVVFFTLPYIISAYHELKSINLVETDLHKAAAQGKLHEVLEQLNKKKAYPMALNPDRETCLHKAAIHGHVGIVKTLLALEDGVGTDLLESQNIRGWTALHLAATAGEIKVCEALCDKGDTEFVLARDKRKQNAFLMASYQGHIDIMELLIKKGGEQQLKSANDTGGTAMHYACIGGKAKVINWLIERGGADVIMAVDESGSTGMHKACEMGHLEVVKILALKGGEQVMNAREKGDITPFHRACLEGHLEVVKFFLDKTEDEAINPKDNRGWTCLHFAASEGHAEVCKLLLEKGGVDLLNDRDSLMISSMDYALQNKFEACIEVMQPYATSTSSGAPVGVMFRRAFGGMGAQAVHD